MYPLSLWSAKVRILLSLYPTLLIYFLPATDLEKCRPWWWWSIITVEIFFTFWSTYLLTHSLPAPPSQSRLLFGGVPLPDPSKSRSVPGPYTCRTYLDMHRFTLISFNHHISPASFGHPQYSMIRLWEDSRRHTYRSKFPN